MLLRISFISALLACFLLFSCGSALEKEKAAKKSNGAAGKKDKNVGGGGGGGGGVTVGVNKQKERVRTDRRRGDNKDSTPSERSKVKEGPRSDAGCARLGGICQRSRYICQGGRYLTDKCASAPPGSRQCCVPGSGAWSVLCAGHHNNRVRACDVYGCGYFNAPREGYIHQAVDVVCDDYGVVNAPFSGVLGASGGRRPGGGIQQDGGVKLSNAEYCVKIFNIRPYHYQGSITQGAPLGYLLPLQESFSGVTSHLEVQMCDLSDPSPYI